jgi:uncharacterized membrane protein
MSETLIDDRSGSGPEDADPTLDPPAPPPPVDPPSGDVPAPGGRVSRAIDRFLSMPLEGWITLFILVACVAFVFVQLGPSNIFANNTPAGGDMGAHVWGPAFLRDHLLPQGRLTGWTPDWYDGFPAYEFYMILPGLAIALLSYLIPYGIAFKLIVISGVLSLPICLWAFGRLSRLPFPTPALLAVGATAYLFDRSFSIYGGNIASTLAGEFSFSIALSFAVLFLGVLARGLETGKYRAWAAALLAATALCHIIPVFFAVAGAAILFALQLDWRKVRWYVWLAMVPAAFALAAVGGHAILPSGKGNWPLYAPAIVFYAGLVVLLSVVLTVAQRPWGHIKYLATVLPVGGLISAFWTGPFYFNSAYMTDMGWEKLTNYSDSLFVRSQLAAQLSDRPGIQYLLMLAAVGALMAFAYCRRGEIFWVAMAVVMGIAFLYVPQSRLWNARLLPFYYLAIYLVGAIAVAEVGRTVARLLASDVHRPPRVVLWITALGGLAAWLVVLGLPLRTLPFGSIDKDGVTYQWGPFKTKDSSFVTSWASWNFTGYEGKASYPEYYAVVQQMAKIGQDQGCGRAMWEYSDALNNYGTPMALMLLPYWTNGCIGSMEGLYFEASATTPYHFLNQSELSTAPSDAMRGLPYVQGALTQSDFDLGVSHLQMLGVRYYMASTATTIGFAKNNHSLTQLATSGPWVIYQVADSSEVVPLTNEPVVVNGAAKGGKTWLNDTVNWYLDPGQWNVLLAASGPSSWQRIDPGAVPGKRSVGQTKVSNLDTGTDTISFDVTKVGVPVEVKASYFPNWQVSGAKGPYRVSPNMMVVIPTSTHVKLSYGYTTSDYASYLLTLFGLIGLFALWKAKPVEVEPIAAMWRTEDDPDDVPAADPRDPNWWVDPPDGLGRSPDPSAEWVSSGAGPPGAGPAPSEATSDAAARPDPAAIIARLVPEAADPQPPVDVTSPADGTPSAAGAATDGPRSTPPAPAPPDAAPSPPLRPDPSGA